ncbi:cysteine desulfurase, partial [Pseudomonas aeruginosa]|uniref:cysteine desulfurase n=1 Tax=Pseudomonas aeruginosa TaxID=287 RepID=UPI001C67FD35
MSLPSPWRADFPAFSAFAAEGLTYLDSAATAQKPQAVLDALNGYYLGGAANVHRAQHVPGERATRAFEAARSRVAHWLHAGNPAEVLFTRGTTEAINLVAYGLERHFRPGDELLVSALEHHANLLPWQQLALRRGLVLRVLPLDERGVIDLEQARHIIGERTRLLAISQLSNVLGTWQPVVELIQLARERGAWTLVDGAQGSVHGRHDLPGLGCDFYAFSGHKLYGPDGIGVLWGRPQALEQLAHWQFGGEMVRHTGFHEASFHAAPLGFEAGTPAVSAAIGLGATIDWLATLDEAEVAAHEGALHALSLIHISEPTRRS